MKSYKEFKRENGVESFKFRKSAKTGRWVADSSMSLVVSGKFTGDAKELSEFLASDVFVSPATAKDGSPILVICRQGWADSAEG